MSYSKPSNKADTKKRVLVIPAAGAGVRFRELGKNYPKCILPVEGKPIVVRAIEMLAEKTGVFDLVIVAFGSPEHGAAIVDALVPHKFKTELKCLMVDVPDGFAPSPAISLGEAMRYAVDRFGKDVDVTVFLSDMLPVSQEIADRVANILPDTWGVVEKPDGDFKRWCMVAEASNRTAPLMLLFYDKPSKQPPTNYAACGVYRYSSAVLYRAKLMDVMNTCEDHTKELQFSDVAMPYQTSTWTPFACAKFSDVNFKDYGTLEEYLANKGIARCRSFNTVVEEGRSVIKTSTDTVKIRNEVVWLTNVPPVLEEFVPRVESYDLMRGVVKMQKIRSTNLRDMALYLDRSYETWIEIFKKVFDFNTAVINTTVDGTQEEFWDNMFCKTHKRVHSFVSSPREQSWVRDHFPAVIAAAKNCKNDPVVYYHGDLHFANMFYCSHYRDLTVIDPRGEVRGSRLYDLAKLCHSVYGRYDYIDADLYRVDPNLKFKFYDRGHENIERAFFDVIFGKLTDTEKWIVLQLTASLFLSMIPLHDDNHEHCHAFRLEFEKMLKLSQQYAG